MGDSNEDVGKLFLQLRFFVGWEWRRVGESYCVVRGLMLETGADQEVVAQRMAPEELISLL